MGRARYGDQSCTTEPSNDGDTDVDREGQCGRDPVFVSIQVVRGGTEERFMRFVKNTKRTGNSDSVASAVRCDLASNVII